MAGLTRKEICECISIIDNSIFMNGICYKTLENNDYSKLDKDDIAYVKMCKKRHSGILHCMKKLRKELDRMLTDKVDHAVLAIRMWDSAFCTKIPDGEILHYSSSWKRAKIEMNYIYRLIMHKLEHELVEDYNVDVIKDEGEQRYIIEVKYKNGLHSDSWQMTRFWVENLSSKVDEYLINLESYIDFSEEFSSERNL